MKNLLFNKTLSFIVSMMILLLLPVIANAQRCHESRTCPRGKICVNGICKRFGFWNDLVSPLPLAWDWQYGFLFNEAHSDDVTQTIPGVADAQKQSYNCKSQKNDTYEDVHFASASLGCNCLVRPIPFRCRPYCSFSMVADAQAAADAQASAYRTCRRDRDCGGRGWHCFRGWCYYRPWLTSPGDLSDNDITDFSSIQYSLESDGIVSISLYDVSGQLIRDLVDEWMPSGEHDLVWNEKDDTGNTLSPGVYLLTLQAGDISETTRVVAMD